MAESLRTGSTSGPDVCRTCGEWKQSSHCHCRSEAAQQIAALEAQVRGLTQERDALQEEHEALWKALERGYAIEPRAVFEREAPTNGFRWPLAQALHHIW